VANENLGSKKRFFPGKKRKKGKKDKERIYLKLAPVKWEVRISWTRYRISSFIWEFVKSIKANRREFRVYYQRVLGTIKENFILPPEASLSLGRALTLEANPFSNEPKSVCRGGRSHTGGLVVLVR
jgi:hypothetical protein